MAQWYPTVAWRWGKWTLGIWRDMRNCTRFGIDAGPLEIVWRAPGYRVPAPEEGFRMALDELWGLYDGPVGAISPEVLEIARDNHWRLWHMTQQEAS